MVSFYWRKVSTSGENGKLPEPRYGHSATLLGDNKQLLVFAGWHRKDSTSFNDLWLLEISKMKWHQPSVQGPSPQARGGHTATLIGTNLFVFGGQNRTTIFNDLFILDTENMVWREAKVSGQIPESRSQHIAMANGTDLYVLLGHDGYGKMYNDLYVLNTETLQWRKLKTSGNLPSAVGAATATLIDTKIHVFGGRHFPHTYSNDLYTLDLETLEWECIETRGHLPPPRAAHSSTLVGSELFIFGGSNGKDRLNDLFILDPEKRTWYQPYVQGSIPGAHSVHTATHVGPFIFVYGGFDGSECFSDVYVLDTESPCR